jgi:pilus assembly protein CpaF
MMSIIQFIRDTFAIRVQEMAFELNLRVIYPDRNVMTLRQTDTTSGQEGLNVQKKMDGSCNLLGEVADQETTRWAIQICQTGSNQLIATHHANSTPDLLKAFSDYSNDRSKLELAATSLNFDIHLSRTPDGHRYVERITAICPHVAEEYSHDSDEAMKQYFFRETDRQVFDVVDVLRWEDGVYKFVGCIDDRNREKIAGTLTKNERAQFYDFCDRIKAEVGA